MSSQSPSPPRSVVLKGLREMPNVGSRTAEDLWRLGVRSAADLTPEQKTVLRDAAKTLDAAGGNYRKILEVQQVVLPLLARGMGFAGGGGGGFGGRMGGGLMAEAGTYIAKLDVAGKTSTIKVERALISGVMPRLTEE